MARQGKPGISKVTGYRMRIFTAPYDLNNMRKAYGIRGVIELLQAYEANEVKNINDAYDILEADYGDIDAEDIEDAA